MSLIIAWLNILSALIGVLGFGYFYLLSVMPATRAEKHGSKAWKECQRFRKLAAFFAVIPVINMILWLLYPIPGLDWNIHSDPLVPIVLGIAIATPCTLVLIKAMMDVGRETWQPSTETKMAKGIYRHIRHPQLLGRPPWYIAIALWVNSLFLLIVVVISLVILIPLMIHYEEKDLLKRFGNTYREYQKRTGALFPKICRKKHDSKITSTG
ncbi:MAG: methyltransferase family protein [Promethearchaeota archaeon]